MLIVAYIVFGFAVVQLVVALVNLLFRQPLPKPDSKFQPLVSVLIPARNEELNIGNLLSDLQQQSYKNIEVIVFNDQSEDQTAEIVKKYTGTNGHIKLMNSEFLPEGWLGKNNGCFQLAQRAKGEYFLFLDADVRISGNIIHQTVAAVRKHRLGLLTIFPKQILNTWGEYFVVPSMNYILLTLLPLILVRKSKLAAFSAGNGQFMLFDAETYRNEQPHEKHRLIHVEDISIARSFKKAGISIACLAGNKDIRCRMYGGFKAAVKGLSRSVIMFFGNSVALAIIFWLMTTLGIVFVWLELPVYAFWAYLLVLLLTRIFISIVSRQHLLKNLLLGYFQKWVLGYITSKAIYSKINATHEWKGRNIA
jgi:glycosyltransferase involved in cell wall biosynthesis